MNFSALILVKTSIFKILRSGENLCASQRLQKQLKTNETRCSVYHPVTTRLAAVGEGLHRFYGRVNDQEPEVGQKIYSAPSPTTGADCGEEVLVVGLLVTTAQLLGS